MTTAPLWCSGIIAFAATALAGLCTNLVTDSSSFPCLRELSRNEFERPAVIADCYRPNGAFARQSIGLLRGSAMGPLGYCYVTPTLNGAGGLVEQPPSGLTS